VTDGSVIEGNTTDGVGGSGGSASNGNGNGKEVESGDHIASGTGGSPDGSTFSYVLVSCELYAISDSIAFAVGGVSGNGGGATSSDAHTVDAGVSL
jgi:hypothetical protein